MDFKKKEIIGMIHLAGPDVVAKAMEEIKTYEEEGLSGIIIENYHGSVDDVIATLEALVLTPTTMSVGINILPNEYETAFELCEKYSFINFIQLDYISGVYGKENKKIDVHDYITLASKHDNVKVYGGVWPKYYTPVEGSDLKNDLLEALFLADGVVVTGNATGDETPIEKISEFRTILDGNRTSYIRGDKRPLIVGAGLTPLNVREQLSIAQGGIVGSAFKPRGRTNQMVDRELVKHFMSEVKKI